MQNGAAAGGDKIGPRKLIDRVQYVKLIEQALFRLGYADVARKLEQESGIQMQPESATAFQSKVLSGDWDGALALLPQLTSRDDVLRNSRFLVLQQKYLEALERQDLPSALQVLRCEMAPLRVQDQQLHHLAGLLLCPATPPGGASRCDWLGGGAGQRGHLLAQLQAQLPPSLLVPDGRLEQLVDQALMAQISRCPYHNALTASLSLFSDYTAGVELLPTKCTHTLEPHTDEVWHIAFSHSGRLLASASKDRTAGVFRVAPLAAALAAAAGSGGGSTPAAAPAAAGLQQQPGSLGLIQLHSLRGHDAAVSHLAWSPDDTLLLTVSDRTIRLWDVGSGHVLHSYTHDDAVAAAAWLPDGRRFLAGGVDRCLYIHDVRLGGAGGGGAGGGGGGGGGGGAVAGESQRLKRPYRIQDLALSRSGAVAVLADNDSRIHLLRLSDHKEVTLQETLPIMSIGLMSGGGSSGGGDGGSSSSSCSGHLLVALRDHTLHLWDLGPAALGPYPQSLDVGPDPLDSLPTGPEAEFQTNDGQPGRYVLRSSFGGSEGSFVVHGSEDCTVYIWHRDSGEMLMRLEGHAGTVNSVVWNPTNPYMLASASDDRTIRIWMAEEGLKAAPSPLVAAELAPSGPVVAADGGGGGGSVDANGGPTQMEVTQ